MQKKPKGKIFEIKAGEKGRNPMFLVCPGQVKCSKRRCRDGCRLRVPEEITLTDSIKLKKLGDGWQTMIRLDKKAGSFFFPTGPTLGTPERCIQYIREKQPN